MYNLLERIPTFKTLFPLLVIVLKWWGGKSGLPSPAPPHPNNILPPSLRDLRWPGTKEDDFFGIQPPLRRDGDRQMGLRWMGRSRDGWWCCSKWWPGVLWWRRLSLLPADDTGGLLGFGSSRKDILNWSSSINFCSSSIYLKKIIFLILSLSWNQ